MSRKDRAKVSLVKQYERALQQLAHQTAFINAASSPAGARMTGDRYAHLTVTPARAMVWADINWVESWTDPS